MQSLTLRSYGQLCKAAIYALKLGHYPILNNQDRMLYKSETPKFP
jgi:hypothetical protein